MEDVNEMKNKQIHLLCSSVKKLIRAGDYKNAFKMIYESMSQFPDNPEPHNLLGILLEKCGDHISAMKHFQVAWVLDPTYRPANHNLLNCSNFYSNLKYAYDENDCSEEKKSGYRIIYNDRHIGHAERLR